MIDIAEITAVSDLKDVFVNFYSLNILCKRESPLFQVSEKSPSGPTNYTSWFITEFF